MGNGLLTKKSIVKKKSSGKQSKKDSLIEKITFRGDFMMVYINDGRIVTVPLSRFPEIGRLTSTQRKKYGTLGGYGLAFADLDNVYHISDFLGIQNTQGL